MAALPVDVEVANNGPHHVAVEHEWRGMDGCSFVAPEGAAPGLAVTVTLLDRCRVTVDLAARLAWLDLNGSSITLTLEDVETPDGEPIDTASLCGLRIGVVLMEDG